MACPMAAKAERKIYMEKPLRTKLGGKNWAALALLAFSGQIAWAVENSWFNTFVHDEISPDPRVISAMVAASAITATITALLMGTLSDRIGKRRVMILAGYVLWGISTVIFPTVSLIKTIGLAVFMVVLADCVMTFFGSTANDACFNAWITDVTDETNRGFVSGVNEMFPLLALVVSTVVAGALIEAKGYFTFFILLGVLVTACGLLGALLMQSVPVKTPEKQEGYFKQLAGVLNPAFVKQNKAAFILLGAICVFSIGDQVFMPYQMIYFNKVLGYSLKTISMYLGVITLFAGLVGVLFGRIVDRIPRKAALLFALCVSSVGVGALFFAKSLPALCAGIFVMAFGHVAKVIAAGSWLRDLTPPDATGQFQGVRMIFWVMLPMVVGPFIGERVISLLGEAVVVEGKAGYLPAPHIFIIGAAIILLAVLPVLRLRSETVKKETPSR